MSARFGVGKSTVERAIRVKRDGVQELVDRVEAGDMTVTEAARIASETTA